MPMNNVKHLLRHLKWFLPYWNEKRLHLVFVFFTTALAIAAQTSLPLCLKFLIDMLNTKNFSTRSAYLLVGGYLSIAVFTTFIQQLLPFLRLKGNVFFTARIRNDYFKKASEAAPSLWENLTTGDVVTRLTDDIDGSWDRVGWYSCSGIFRPIEAIMVMGLTLGVMFYYSVPLTLASCLPIPIMVFILAKYGDKLTSETNNKQKAISTCYDMLETSLTGIKVIKTTLSEESHLRRYREALDDRVIKEMDFLKINQLLSFLSTLVNNAGFITVLFFGGYLVIHDKITLGTFILFGSYLRVFIGPMWTLSWFFVSSKQTFRYVERIREIGKFPRKHESGSHRIREFHDLSLKNVSFKHSATDRKILEDITFHLKRGEKWAIVGMIGSGKTTLFELITRHYSSGHGTLLVNGRNILEYHGDDLESLIGYVPQDTLLFSDTIKENLLLGADFDKEELTSSLNEAQVLDEVMKLPKGVSTLLGQKGQSLSGGQRQRLAIARTLLRRPKLLLLDDSTAAMDASTEKQFLKQLLSDSTLTCLFSTHRKNVAMKMDKVLVLHDGKLIESGSPRDLYEKNGFFYKLMEKEKATSINVAP
jgi:ABC-type multidrug transport system fused ATPase/permease subunit